MTDTWRNKSKVTQHYPHRETCCAAKVEDVVMDGSKVGKFGEIERQHNLKSVVMDVPIVREFGKVDREQKLKSIVMDGVKSGKGDKVKNVVMDGVRTGEIGKLLN